LDLVRYDIETSKRDVILSADKLIPAGETKPLDIDGYDWSADEKRVLSTQILKRYGGKTPVAITGCSTLPRAS
jgi:hypothetical protein